MNIARNLVVAVLMTIVTTVLLGIIYPLAITGIAQVAVPGTSERAADRAERRRHRFQDHRPGILDARLLPAEAFRDQHAVRCGELRRHRSSARRTRS